MRSRPLPWLLLLLAVGCGAADGTDDPATESDELTSSESAVVTLATQAKSAVYANLTASSGAKIPAALVAAAARGVTVKAILVEGAHDATWQLQQQLEASGVDVDVRKETAAPTVLAIGDGTALVGTATSFKRVTGTAASDGAKKFDEALAASAPKAGALLGAEKVKLLPMPESGDERLVSLLAGAKSSIDLSIYQLQERRVIRALTEASARGVRVRVMLEPRTVGWKNFDPVSKELAHAGVDVRETPPDFDAHHNVDHAKFCLLDGKELVFGTGNLVRSGLGGATLGAYDNRDFWVEDTRAASVKAAQAIFEADLARKSTSGVELGDLVLTPDNASGSIAALVDAAKHRLLVYNQSLNDADLMARLVAAKQRGVDVHVLLGWQPVGHGGANDGAMKQLTDAGITAHYLKAHYLHAKAIVADARAYVGSQNFTSGGLRNNRELGELFDDAALVETVAATFAKDEAAP